MGVGEEETADAAAQRVLSAQGETPQEHYRGMGKKNALRPASPSLFQQVLLCVPASQMFSRAREAPLGDLVLVAVLPP